MRQQMCNDVCMVCEEAITNPICRHCLEKQGTQWAAEKVPGLVPQLQKAGDVFSQMEPGNMTCIICGGDIDVCAHCCCKEMLSVVEEDPELADEFMRLFDFELDV
ncbi:MAG: hypothetical protein ABH879_05480 [archaeon]